jgi:hypothetical protein
MRAIILLIFLSACAKDYYSSTENTGLSLSEAQVVSKDFATVIAANYLPAKVRIHLVNAGDAIGQTLEKALRESGYAVSTSAEDAEPSIKIAYLVDALSEKDIYVRVFDSASCEISRVYGRDQENKLLPKSEFTVRN